jgi:hypothetical protein
MQHRRRMDLLKYADEAMARKKEADVSQKPTSWTPFNENELRVQRAALEMRGDGELREEYTKLLDQCALHGDNKQYPPKPYAMQTLIQIWRVLYRRTPKGR